MSSAAKDGHTRGENLRTQPMRPLRVFNNPCVVTASWYPVCASRSLPVGQARSFKITFQRIVVFRGEDGKARALDAFCPHMGADLGNGRVCGNQLECYFHQFRFDERGCLSGTRGLKKPPQGVKNRAYAVEEKYGFVWVYAGGEHPPYPVPEPPGLEGEELVSVHVTGPLLHAHHHVMMAGGIDLLHFASVHGIDAAFEHTVVEHSPEVADWSVRGTFPETGLRSRLARFVLGPRFGYDARFAGGSVVALTYGPEQRLRGHGRALPPLHILWGCVAEPTGVSRVHIFIVTRKRRGPWGRLHSHGLLALTVALLTLLQDDDVKAFPHMRFNPKALAAEDGSVARLIRFIEGLPLSDWSHDLPAGSGEQRSELQTTEES